MTPSARHQEAWAEVLAELAALERRAAALVRPRPRRSLAALVNFVIFGRWPGETAYRPPPPE